MNHDEVWRTIDAERLSMADLFDDLSEAEWQTPSLCAGWRVRDVAAHLTLAHTGLLAGTVALVRARGGPNRMIRDSAVRQARLPVERYPVALRGMVGSRRTAPFLTPFEPLVDVLVHGQDIAVPLGRTRPMPTAAAATAVVRRTEAARAPARRDRRVLDRGRGPAGGGSHGGAAAARHRTGGRAADAVRPRRPRAGGAAAVLWWFP